MHLKITQFIGLSIALLSCGEGKRFTDGGDGDAGGLEGGGDDGADDSDDDGSDGDDNDSDDDDDGPDVEESDPALVLGTVIVELYIEDDDGERIAYSWDEAVGEDGEFPFGSIFVSAFKSDDVGMERYFDQYTVTRPQIEGDHYLLEIDPNATSMTNIYASLDIRSDGVISSAEPIGVYPDDIIVSEGTEAGDVNISIMVDWGRWGPGGWGWSDSGGGSGCDTLVSVDGPVSITVPYGGGNGMAMLLNTRGDGPYKFDTFTPIATPDGAEADYQMGMCPDAGDYQLVGAYDSNGNGLVDPSDLWGAYVTTEGDEGNPITVGNVDLSPYTLEIPIGAGESPLNVVPFVRLSGTISAPEGSTLLGMGADGVAPSLYMAAMKYRMNTEFPVGAFESSAYEYLAWGPDDIGESESVEWELVVPANSVVYLWAYMDADGDDIVNEIHEPVASSGVGSAGAFTTGEVSQSDLDLNMRVVE